MSVYISERQVRLAQAHLESHMFANRQGICEGCGQREPCRSREAAYGVFDAMRVLPRRVPRAQLYRWLTPADPTRLGP